MDINQSFNHIKTYVYSWTLKRHALLFINVSLPKCDLSLISLTWCVQGVGVGSVWNDDDYPESIWKFKHWWWVLHCLPWFSWPTITDGWALSWEQYVMQIISIMSRLIWRHWAYKMFALYIMSCVCLRLSQYSQLSFLYNGNACFQLVRFSCNHFENKCILPSYYQNGSVNHYPDSKVHGANMGPTWVLSAPRWAPYCPHESCY